MGYQFGPAEFIQAQRVLTTGNLATVGAAVIGPTPSPLSGWLAVEPVPVVQPYSSVRCLQLPNHGTGGDDPLVRRHRSGIRELVEISEVEQWLRGLGLGGYAHTFAEQSVEFDLLSELGDDDLKSLGVTALGHCKRLLRAITALNGAPSRTMPGQPMAAVSMAPRDAERRQLTVMFCDLVGSTVLALRLDPEDLQQLIRSYHTAVGLAITPYEGHVAQYLGDGVLVYFGYPRAHEDDPARAVRSALNLLMALHAGRARGDPELQTRIGIATGLVVVGEIGAGTAAAERSASGETPDAQYLANQRDRPHGAEQKNPGLLHSDSLAKYAVAFFRMSRSIFTRASSARCRASSICTALTGRSPAPRNAPLSAPRTQLLSICLGSPSTRAVTDASYPALTNLMASCLNSTVYRARRCDPSFLLIFGSS